MIKFKTPEFWYRKQSEPIELPEKLLTPFSGLYRKISSIHRKTKSTYISFLPVICVGNITVGGSGKTPTALAILDLIQTHKLAQRPCFLTRGYGGSLRGSVLVDPQTHDASEVGDEALLLARHAPVILSANRREGAQMAEGLGSGIDLLIMDDGLQNPSLHQDLKLLVISGEKGFGNGKTLPAGPLRQDFKTGLAQADAFIITGENQRKISAHLPKDKPVISAALEYVEASLPPTDRRYLAFAGLAHPKAFFYFLKDKTPIKIVKAIPFADHYPYTRQDLIRLHKRAKSMKAHLITTEKDAVRLPKIENIEIATLPVTMQWNKNEDALLQLLQKTIKSKTS